MSQLYWYTDFWDVTYDNLGDMDLEDRLIDSGHAPIEIGRAQVLPSQWAATVTLTVDEHGDPDETEVRLFDSKEEAVVASAARPA